MSASTDLPPAARQLLALIESQIAHGTLRSKSPGIASLPELHEACGLDVDAMYAHLQLLKDANLISIEGEYPFEEIRLIGQST